MRGVSTVLDVSLCLVLVAVAIGTLVASSPATPETTAHETAAQLATTTGAITADADRTVVGTHAELLARATLANLSYAGNSLTPSTGPFRDAVRDRVRRLLDRAPDRTAVSARWSPYPGAPLQGTVSVGPQPPARATVGTARLTVPVPVDRSLMGATDRYGALAEELATAIRSFSLPPASDPSLDRHRLVAYGSALGVPAASRSGLRRALATRLERDLRSRFETATAARRAVQTGRVSVIVREWDM